ncbi:CAP domain-containing protein [Priestia endophytica]|uniref:CAP domain-containing protein n=1 Tax=Priestia endophytica TaxID=135735 RepID=UPI00124BF390|nr:CAP domain-containing protein [Priestia endophytica]KAB2496159.1 hypothetical protein F8155_00900 [Priestia endophytica]
MRKILFVIAVIAIFYAISSIPFKFNDEEKNQQKEEATFSDQKEEASISKESILSLIGKNKDDVSERFGKPDRIDESQYGYKWWIYRSSPSSYMQIGVEKDKVVMVYTIGDNVDVEPYSINETRQEVMKDTPVSPQVQFNYKGNMYQFEMSEADMQMKPLIQYEDVFVQLYFDQYTNKISSIRAMDAKTLIEQRPYELTYRGELISAEKPSKEIQEEIQHGNEQQIFDITNVIRVRHGLNELGWSEGAAKVAYGHSTDMKENNYFNHVSPTFGKLADRLEKGGVSYDTAGENIAAEYQDGIAAVEGWLNSEGHRKAMLNPDFDKLGVGVNEQYYTQNFIAERN